MAAMGGKLSSRGLAFGLVALSVLSVGAQAHPSPHQITVVSENQIDTIPVSEFEGVSMVPLEALANLIGAELRPGAEQGAMLSGNGKVARVSDGRNFVSVEGKLVLLQSPPRRVTGQWFVLPGFMPQRASALSE